MTPERYEQIAQIFAQVREVIPEQRSELLRRLCGDDEELRREVESYLAAEAADVPSLLGAPVIHNAALLASAFDVQSDEISSGTSIGSYRIVRKLGEGGFGNVYLAEQLKPIRRHVALKVIKPGMDSAAVIGRFEHERQTLAILDHPNIARVIDAGTTPKGYPYFVMEYVDGEPITKFCDRHRLTLRQRLELFIPVCEAVQHAHMKGIIHRDITPNNILVAMRDGQPVPKVIDFGIAKAITPGAQAAFTISGQLIGTPEYMSPEQAMRAADIDTRTDVYSLGVVLYELLSGVPPFDSGVLRGAGEDAIRRIIAEEDAPKPSTRLSTIDEQVGSEIAQARRIDREQITRELQRELEWIPLKALRKERARRYASAESFASDLRRYLQGEALAAAPESAAYRLKKTVGTHRGPVLAGAAIFLVLVFGIVSTWTQAKRADRKAADEARAAQIAKEQSARADAQAADATAARLKADNAREAAESEAYVANLMAADASLAFHEPARVRERLNACPDALRGWEWKWLNARSDDSLATLSGHEDRVTSVAFSPDGTRVVTASDDTTARVWDAASGKELAILRGHEKRVASVVFSPDGTRVVTASDDTTARVWDAASGRELAVLRGHEREVVSATFSPDGSRVVTASDDTTARVWDAASGKELAVLRGHAALVFSAAFSPDGTRVVRCPPQTGPSSGTVYQSWTKEGRHDGQAGIFGGADRE